MGKAIIINEKPSQARNFAKALGGMKGIFEGQPYEIVAARGHLYEFASPEKQVGKDLTEQYHSWDVKNLPWNEKDFMWKREKKDGISAVVRDIVTACKGKDVDSVIIATDDDPTAEGQLLAFEIILENNIRAKKFERMYFADESVKEIQKAFRNRVNIPNLLTDSGYRKALYRSKWDFLSMQFTRIATKFGDGKSVLRQGRLKSAMVLLVGDQLKAVAGYKKIPFYSNRFRDENGNIYSDPNAQQYKTREEVPQNLHPSSVTLDSKTKKSTAPNRLIDLAGLAAVLATKGIKSKTVLDTYQRLYEANGGIVSYPRTEDKCITIEQFNDLLPKVDQIARLVGVDPAILTHRTPRPTHIKTGMAHGANRPGLYVPSSLDELDKYGTGAREIYTVLAKSYLAMLAEDYVYEQQKGHVTDFPSYTCTVNVPISQGWHQVGSSSIDDDDSDDSKGIGTKADPFIYEGFPPKPQQPTVKWLMKQLEKHDVGTGATRTSIYADVTNERSKYPLLKEKRGKIEMAEYGQMSYLLLPNTHIGDLAMTENLMHEMELVSQNKADPEECLAKVRQLVEDDIVTMKRNGEAMRKELGKTMSTGDFEQKEKYSGEWNGKKVSFNRKWYTHRFTDDECERLCNGETIDIFGLKSKAGKEYGVTGKLSEQSYNGHKFVGFERLGFANKPGVPERWCKHVFTDEEKTELEAGTTVYIEGAISQKGNVFDCHVRYGEKDDGTMGIIPVFDAK